MDYNPIPAITGRVCPVFCEPECNRKEFDDAVAIQCVERAVGDHVLDKGTVYYAPPKTESGRHVAIVGSGPAGLAAAFYLRRAGHKVTLFEKLAEAGGMLQHSIPPFRLPKDVVRRQVEALKGMGIIFETGVEAGKTMTFSDLGRRFDAILVAGGTWKSLKLNVPGEEAGGVLYALDYLRKVSSGERPALGQEGDRRRRWQRGHRRGSGREEAGGCRGQRCLPRMQGSRFKGPDARARQRESGRRRKRVFASILLSAWRG